MFSVDGLAGGVDEIACPMPKWIIGSKRTGSDGLWTTDPAVLLLDPLAGAFRIGPVLMAGGTTRQNSGSMTDRKLSRDGHLPSLP